MASAPVDTAQLMQEFSEAGRTGRRNALPNVLDARHISYGTADITAALEKISTVASATPNATRTSASDLTSSPEKSKSNGSH